MGLALWAAALLLFAVGAAGDASADRACKIEAKAEYRECKNDCKTEFRVEKDLCRNIDPACGLECRVERAGCIEPFEEALDACKDVCRQIRDAAKAACREQYNDPNDPNFNDPDFLDQCIDGVQIAAFICRDNCREDTVVDDPNTPEVDPVHWRAGIRACRQAAHECFRACPPPPEP
jgi:hypothetical protein